MKQVLTELVKSRSLESDHFLHVYHAPGIAAESMPGQFIHIKVCEGPHPILRRAISIYTADKKNISILFKVVGEGTRLLSEKRTGDILDIIGPLGSAFTIEDKPAVLIAGGIGCAPLCFLAERLKKRGINITFLYGAKSGSDLVKKEEIAKLCDTFICSTEDASSGIKGFIIPPSLEFLNNENAIYSCGPEAMLYSLYIELKKRNVSAQLSLENRMACGVGACQGCAVETTSGFLRACVEGPVFNSDDILSFPVSGLGRSYTLKNTGNKS
jgi:dihydroorotate dehydrogenase electron transfer subunit